ERGFVRRRVIARGRQYPRWCSLRVPLASCLRLGVSTLAQASHLSPARVALLWRAAKAARAASPTPVTCAEQDASGRDHSTRRARRDLRAGRAGDACSRRCPHRRRRRRHRQLGRRGTWAARVLAPAATVAARPPEASWEAGGAFPIPALTAAQALDEALGIESGGWVVVNGAGGVTGGLLVQLAAARGARVIATASAKKAERIRDYGASEVLDYHGDWPALVRELTGGGAPKAVNAAPGPGGTPVKAVADGGAPAR